MFRKVLLASDGSENALNAARTAAEIVKKFEGTLTVIHVFAAPISIPLNYGTPGFDLDPDMMNRYAEEIRTAVERRTSHVLDECGATYESRQELGHPGEVICKVAEEEQFDLIVLGSRGLGQFKSLVMGSVSTYVSHHSSCPLLIVK